MELPTSAPPGSDGTHDFLSLYTSSSQDPPPRSHRQSSPGNFLKTHNFLQPLEMPAECKSAAVTTTKNVNSSVQHILPGGIGTYTISHISYIDQISKPQVSLSPVAQAGSNERNNDISNTSSQTGSGFTLWDESAVNKGKTGNENNVGDTRSIVRESDPRLGQWSAERPSQSPFNQCGSFAPGSSSKVAVQGNRSFMDLIVSKKNTREETAVCEVDFVIKKEGSPSERDDFSRSTDGITAERKANTPRSKHSATEQRRRSKINDRFQMLREIIPHSDQKRDKASFLLEAIEYIQYLQEKVHRYEGSFPGRNNESAKQIPLRNHCQPSQGFRGNCGHIPVGEQKLGDSKIINPTVVCPIPSQPKMFAESGAKIHVPTILVSDKENVTSKHLELGDVRQCKMESVPNEELMDQEVNIEGGTINIASAYSQGFLNKLTHALESLGMDLSESRISVQINLGKQSKLKLCSTETVIKVKNMNSTSQVKGNSSLPFASKYSGQVQKRLKTGNHL